MTDMEAGNNSSGIIIKASNIEITSENDILKLQHGFINKNTQKKREWAVRKFENWRNARNEVSEIKITLKYIENLIWTDKAHFHLSG